MLCRVCVSQVEEEHLSCAMKFTCPQYSALIFYTSKLMQLICPEFCDAWTNYINISVGVLRLTWCSTCVLRTVYMAHILLPLPMIVHNEQNAACAIIDCLVDD